MQVPLDRGYIPTILNSFMHRKQAIELVTFTEPFLVLPHGNAASCYSVMGLHAVLRVLMAGVLKT